jgi:ABC-type Na+ efflux pump permease subunit
MGGVVKSAKIVPVAALAIAVIVAVGVGLLYVGRPTPDLDGQPDNFTIGTAILVVGYFLFPILALVASGLLFIALLLLIASGFERRRANREAHDGRLR